MELSDRAVLRVPAATGNVRRQSRNQRRSSAATGSARARALLVAGVAVELGLGVLYGLDALPGAAMHAGLLVIVAAAAATARTRLPAVLRPKTPPSAARTDDNTRLLTLAASITGADAAALLLPDGYGGLQVAAVHGDVVAATGTIAPRKGIVGACLAVGRPLVVARVPERPDALPYRRGAHRVTSAICAPVAAPSGVAVLALERSGDEPFSDADIARLEPLLAVGERFLSLTEHARSHSLEVGRSTRHIEALRSISEAGSQEAVAARLVEAAIALTGAHEGEWIAAEAVQPGSLAAISLEQALALPQAGITRSAATPLRTAGDPWTRSAGTSARSIPLGTPGTDGLPVRLGALCLAGGRPGCLDDDAVAALAPLLHAAAAALARLDALRSAEQAAATDPLTGLANRGALNVGLAERLLAARMRGTAVAVLLFDVDHFKRINDTYGHPAGDAVLRMIAATLADGVRKDDLATRYGGEEFAIVLSGAPPDVAAALAERIRATLASKAMPVQTTEGPLRVTISVGVASAPRCGSTPDELMAAADRALYEAKQTGRNRVVVA